MKKALAWLLVIAMTAALAVGGTLAYLTDTDEDVNVMTVGKVKIDQLEYEREDPETNGDDAVVQEFHNNKPLYPSVIKDGFDWDTTDGIVDWEQIGKENYTSGIWNPQNINNELDKMVFVKNKGDFDAHVRSVFAFEAGKYETLADYLADVHLNLNETDWTWEWSEPPVEIGGGKYFIATATYNKVLAPGALTEISLSQIALDPTVTNEDVAGFGDTFQVLVQSQAVQADGFEDADSALTEAFGELVYDGAGDGQPPFEVDPDDVPFENDSPVSGADVKTAIHYLNANTANEKITTKVTSVTFGLNKDYGNITDSYDGVLAGVEQDVPVYAYYVPNGSNYDVYLLANDEIYAPKNSKQLFSGMSSLTEVDTSNLDVSRVEDMYGMFLNCKVLKTLDVSDWDTSNVVSTSGMFANCHEISGLDTSGWDLSNNTTTYFMFQKCYKLDSLDASNWGMESLTTMEGTFAYCEGLTELDLSGWDVSNVTSMLDTFKYCYNLKTVDTTGWSAPNVTTTKRMFFHTYALEEVKGITDWNLVNNTDMYYMFEQCRALKNLDLSGWNIQSVENMQGIFFHCEGLETVDVSGWDTSKSTTMYATFYWCKSLKEIKGLADWDVSSVTNMEQMFRNCHELTSLDIAGWRPGKCTTFSSMFSDGDSNTGYMKLKELDIGQWDMSSAQNINWMFYGCGQLTELDLSGWDTSNITTMHHAFADCMKMETYNFTGWDTSKVTTMDGIFNSNKALKSVDVSEFDTQNVVDFDQFFDGCTSLEEIIGLDKWDTSKGQTFGEFLLNTKVRVLDLSSFDMSSATYVVNMFHINYELTTIYAGDNWNLNPDQLSQTGGMINYSPKLVGGQGTTYSSSDASYMHIDGGEEAPGYLTYKPAQ